MTGGGIQPLLRGVVVVRDMIVLWWIVSVGGECVLWVRDCGESELGMRSAGREADNKGSDRGVGRGGQVRGVRGARVGGRRDCCVWCHWRECR